MNIYTNSLFNFNLHRIYMGLTHRKIYFLLLTSLMVDYFKQLEGRDQAYILLSYLINLTKEEDHVDYSSQEGLVCTFFSIASVSLGRNGYWKPNKFFNDLHKFYLLHNHLLLMEHHQQTTIRRSLCMELRYQIRYNSQEYFVLMQEGFKSIIKNIFI